MDLLHLANQILEWRDRINRLTQECNRLEKYNEIIKKERDDFEQENIALRQGIEVLKNRCAELDVWTRAIPGEPPARARDPRLERMPRIIGRAGPDEGEVK